MLLGGHVGPHAVEATGGQLALEEGCGEVPRFGDHPIRPVVLVDHVGERHQPDGPGRAAAIGFVHVDPVDDFASTLLVDIESFPGCGPAPGGRGPEEGPGKAVPGGPNQPQSA